MSKASRGFALGLVLGAACTLATGLLMTNHGAITMIHTSQLPELTVATRWVFNNLGWSLPVFALLLCLYVASLFKLRHQLAIGASVEKIAQCDHLVDTWTSLFFGVGVIWTAIGMRSALVFALGDPEATLGLGAYDILDRMVQGGILVALSTTIVGGIGGYLLRVIKTLTVEPEIKRYYDNAANAPGNRIQATLSSMEGLLRTLAQRSVQ